MHSQQQFKIFSFHSKMNKLTKKPKQKTSEITLFSNYCEDPGPDQVQSRKVSRLICCFHFQFLQSLRVYICSPTRMGLLLLLCYIYTQELPFEGCFLMILQENPTYTIFFYEEPWNHLFPWRNVSVQYQNRMQLELSVLIFFHTQTAVSKQLTYFLYKQNICFQRSHTYQLILNNDKKSLCLAVLILPCHVYACWQV